MREYLEGQQFIMIVFDIVTWRTHYQPLSIVFPKSNLVVVFPCCYEAILSPELPESAGKRC